MDTEIDPDIAVTVRDYDLLETWIVDAANPDDHGDAAALVALARVAMCLGRKLSPRAMDAYISATETLNTPDTEEDTPSPKEDSQR